MRQFSGLAGGFGSAMSTTSHSPLPRVGAACPLCLRLRIRLEYPANHKPFSYFPGMCIVGWVMDDPSPTEPFVSSRLCVTQTGAGPADSETCADGGPTEMPEMPLPHPADGPPPRFEEDTSLTRELVFRPQAPGATHPRALRWRFAPSPPAARLQRQLESIFLLVIASVAKQSISCPRRILQGRKLDCRVACGSSQ